MSAPPTLYRRKCSRIDMRWFPGQYITEAGNPIPAKHTPEFRQIADAATAAIARAMTKG